MTILVIAPHPDDEVIGVGGTILKHYLAGDSVHVCIVTKGMPHLFNQEMVEMGRREAKIANVMLGVDTLTFLDYPAAELDRVPLNKMIRSFEETISKLKPDEVYIPHRGDIHNDHKVVADAAMVALRPKYQHKVKRVYAYEVPSETGWDRPSADNAFIPNVYEDISETLEAKLIALEYYQSQAEKWPGARSEQAVEALAKYRGSTVCTDAAEAFQLIRELR